MSRFASRLRQSIPLPIPPVGGGAVKPTDATTGPRIATTDMAGGSISGTYSGKNFTTAVTPSGPLTLTDCTLSGGLDTAVGPILLDHCDVIGWFQVASHSTNPNNQTLTAKFVKFTGANDNDLMHIGDETWGSPSTSYNNVLFEDCILYSPFVDLNDGSHFDLIQFSGGFGSTTLNRVVMSYLDQPFLGAATNHINNGTENPNVAATDLWLEGGPMGYCFGGPMTITNGIFEQHTAYWGYKYDNRTVFVNCKDEYGNAVT